MDNDFQDMFNKGENREERIKQIREKLSNKLDEMTTSKKEELFMTYAEVKANAAVLSTELTNAVHHIERALSAMDKLDSVFVKKLGLGKEHMNLSSDQRELLVKTMEALTYMANSKNLLDT